MKDFISKKRIYSFAGILFLLIAWKIVSLYSGSEQIMPSPEAVFGQTFRIFGEAEFLKSLSITLLRGLAGFFISVLLAALIGFPAGLHTEFFWFINPLLVSIRSTPVVALILLAIIWFGNEMVPVFIAILTMFPIMCLNIIEGLRQIDRDLVNMGLSYKISRRRIITGIYIPSILPFLTGGISSAMGFGWRAIIIGEVLSQPAYGIGTRMQEARSFLLVSELIAWTLVAIMVSFLFEMLIRQVEKQYIRWR